MKLNYDCVRDTLICLENYLGYKISPVSKSVEQIDITVAKLYDLMSDYTNEDVFYTVNKLAEGNYITVEYIGDKEKILNKVFDITYSGHEYLDSIKNPKVWNKIKSTAQDKAIDLSFNAVSILAKQLIAAILSL